MGFSVTTAAGAKVITVSYVNQGSLSKPPLKRRSDPGRAGPLANLHPLQALADIRFLLTDESGRASLPKIQMLFWTMLAMVIYITISTHLIGSIDGMTRDAFRAALTRSPNDYGLPDIGAALMVLMGLSQGAYLGLKLSSTDAPRLTSIDNSQLRPRVPFTLTGIGLGDDSGEIRVNGLRAPLAGAPTWTDAAVSATLDPNWTAAPAGPGTITVAYGGAESNGLAVTLPPVLNGISQAQLSLTGGGPFSVYGQGLGEANAGQILIGQKLAPVSIQRWLPYQIDGELNPYKKVNISKKQEIKKKEDKK